MIHVRDLTKIYARKNKEVHALSNVSFDIEYGETLGLVGESGCGKSTVAKCLLRLVEPTSGSLLYEGKEIWSLKGKELKNFRQKTSIIFQDPYASLNPRMTAGDIISEPLQIHNLAKGDAKNQQIESLLKLVGLPPESSSRFPHEFSGGQRQRIGIARALAASPHFVICDEPISALDVSVQAQIINLLKNLQKQMGLTLLFIAHDLRVVKYVSTRIAVMYLGTIVETAPTEELFEKPLHPYTEALLSAIPIPDPILERKRSRILLTGDVPNPFEPPKGCPFASRCPKALSHCREVRPKMREISPGHHAACHLLSPTAPEPLIQITSNSIEI